MKVLVIVALFLGVASAFELNKFLDDEWELFKTSYAKKYSHLGEELERRAIYEKNVAYIDGHNFLFATGQKSYRLKMNKFGDMTSEEVAAMLNGYKMGNQTGTLYQMDESKPAPKTVDWRKKGYVTPIKDQGQCGSCWAFSTTGSLEGQHFKKIGHLVSLSEQNLVDCSGSEGNNGCDGGLMDQAFDYIHKNKGIDTETSYPYTAEDGTCHFKRSAVGATVESHKDIPQGNEKALTSALATVGPISVAIDASQSSFQFYHSGVYDEPDCSSTFLDHGVLAVGYGTQGGKDYYIVKNSWGTEWGLNGFILMSRNKDNQCGIATSASYPIV